MAKYIDASKVLNEFNKQMFGNEAATSLTGADLLVDIGTKLEAKKWGTDVVYKTLADVVGKMVFENKPYKGRYQKIFRDSWEWGNMLQSVRVMPIEAQEDPSKNPVSGRDYPLTQYNSMTVKSKFYSDFDNFQLVYWRPNSDLEKSAFKSMEDWTKFVSAMDIAVKSSLNKRLQLTVRLTINSMIGQTMHKAVPDGQYGNYTGPLGINVLKIYKTLNPTSDITAANCLSPKYADFQALVSQTMNEYKDYIQDLNSDFNIDGEEEYTDEDDICVTILTKLESALRYNVYLNSFNWEMAKLPGYETVASWQTNHDLSSFNECSDIWQPIKTGDGLNYDFHMNGILGIMYDINAVGVNCQSEKVTTFYHPDLDQTKFYHKVAAQYINKFDKNFIVFYVADEAA